jgi:hypothetical protein
MCAEQTSSSREKTFKLIRVFNRASLQEYKALSFDFVCSFLGPKLPDHAFTSIHSIRTWYKTVLDCWLSDVHFPVRVWKDKIESNERALALLNIAIEARNTGVRKIQKSIFRAWDNKFRKLPIANYAELNEWCSLMFELLEDDVKYVDNQRQILTIRYDQGIKYRLEQKLGDYKKIEDRKERLIASFGIRFDFKIMTLNPGKARKLGMDDDWILVVWSGLTDEQSLREITSHLFIDVEKQPKIPNQKILEDIILSIWHTMRELGEICYGEPSVRTIRELRNHLDAVKLWCKKLSKPPKNINPLRAQVFPIPFENFSPQEFERLVLAYHIRTEPSHSWEWLGQSGNDLGRDIWGIEIRENGKQENVCIQCANRKEVEATKAIQAINSILKSSSGKPDVFKFVVACPMSAKKREKIKEFAKTKGISKCVIWSGKEFEEYLRSRCESLVKRFVEGEAFPDSSKRLKKFVSTEN